MARATSPDEGEEVRKQHKLKAAALDVAKDVRQD
jgi:hypothetical protein